jgi:hypothetical protein
MGAYSTVVWHSNDFTDLSEPYHNKAEIVKYLNFGGNFLYAGYRPARAFENTFGNPVIFDEGDFIYDYLKIDTAYYSLAALFIGALPIESGYYSIFVDSSKTLFEYEYHLRFIEGISSSAEGEQIFSFDTNFDSASVQGSFKGKPVGVEYMGNDFKTITLSFPLYYMNKESAKGLIEFIMTNKFDEVLPIDKENKTIPTMYVLEQNYPNPFNPTTKISWQLPVGSWQTLKVYDVLGNEVITIVDEYRPAGKYEVEFSASDLPSGVYFYQLKAGEYVNTKKMLLLK